MRRSLALALLVLGASAALACHTGDRLFRITPFEGNAASDRVNLWPLAYRNGSETSVLWPLFDVDQRGFALRPLVAKDGTGYSILYPLASFDSDAGEGWIGPFYSFGGQRGLFPLANLGTWNWVGPVWWRGGAGGLFPLATFADFNYVGPIWWTEGEHAMGGLFPLVTFAGTSWVGPVWWQSGGEGYGLFPLFGRGFFGVDHLGPLWRRRQEDEVSGERSTDFGLFPLLYWSDGGKGFGFLPFYAHDRGAEKSEQNFLLGLGHRSRTPSREQSWLLPLWFRREEPERDDTVLVPFFWKRTRGEESDVYTLLGNRAADAGSTTLNIYPLWWSNESDEDAWRMLVPFFYYRREADERTLITPLGGRGWSSSDEGAFVNVLGPLYHHSESRHSESRRRDEEYTAFLWPLFERERDGEKRRTSLAGLYTRRSRPARTDTSLLFGLAHARRSEGGSSRRLWPLYSSSDEEELPGFLYDLTLYGRHARDDGTTRRRLFPLFWGERGPESSEWNALLGLVHHEREPTGGSGWAWPLWSYSRGRPLSFADGTALVGWARDEDSRHFQLGTSLLYSRSSEENASVRRERGRALLFFTHEKERLLGTHVPAAEPLSAENRVRHSSRAFLFDAFVSERGTYSTWREGSIGAEEAQALHAYSTGAPHGAMPDRATIHATLAAHGVPVQGDDPAALRRAIETFAAANSCTRERRHVRFPLVWEQERSEDELDWSGPLGLVHYERDPERSRLRLLYYGYRSETRAGRTRRDIFPFITWDSGPAEARFSFLWRFLRYERDGERRGGHVLFIPWGNV